MRRSSRENFREHTGLDESWRKMQKPSDYYDRPVGRTLVRGRRPRRTPRFMTTNPIIVALDVETAGEARALVNRIGSAVSFYKVGMELYAAAGMDFVRELIAGG